VRINVNVNQFVKVAKIAKLFRSPRNVKRHGNEIVIAIYQEMTPGKGPFSDVDGRHAEKAKTEHSTAKNSRGWMRRRETHDSRQSTDRMVERTVGALMSMTSEGCDDRAGQ